MGTVASQGNAWGVWQAAHKHRCVLHPALRNHTNGLVFKDFIASSPLLHPEAISFIKHSSWHFKHLCLLAVLGTVTQDNLRRGYSGPLHLRLPYMTVTCRRPHSLPCSLLREAWLADSQRATGKSNWFLAYTKCTVLLGHWIDEFNVKLPRVPMWQDAIRKSHWKEEEMWHNTRSK